MSIFFDNNLLNNINGRKIISIVCSGGMTSSMLAQRMQKHIDEQKLPYYVMFSGIESLGDTDFLSLYSNMIKVVYVAPQVHHQYEFAKESMAPFKVPVFKIDGRVFGTMNYKLMVSDALACIEQVTV